VTGLESSRSGVKARAQRFRDAPMQDFVPILVARDVRRSRLRRR
jgi:hypothetical protein